MKYGNVGRENGCFSSPTPPHPHTHTWSFAHLEQREESNSGDVSKNSNTIVAPEYKNTTHDSYLGSVVVSKSLTIGC
jgi:hypothetical protein